MLARDLQRDQHLPQQIGVMSPILVGLDGSRRMGKSLGNYIGIAEPPYDMMKKIMQLPDAVMKMYFELLTSIGLEEVQTILAGHPKSAKIRLAKAVIAEYHSPQQSENAADRWQREVGGGERPSEIPIVTLSMTSLSEHLPRHATDLAARRLAAPQLLQALGLAASASEATRLISQGGASVIRGDQTLPITDSKTPILLESEMLVKAGKKRIVKLTIID